jgi:hypothetical protein
MPRPLAGRVIQRHLSDGRLAFDIRIRDRQVLAGYGPEWSRERAEHVLRASLLPRALLKQPWWEELVRPEDDDAAASRGPVTVREAASEYVSRLLGQYSNDATLNAYISPVMKHIGPFFTYDGARERRVDEINGTLVSSFTATKMAERELLSNLAATLAQLDDEDRRDPGRLRQLLDSEAERTCSSATGSAAAGVRWPKRSGRATPGGSRCRRAACPTTRSSFRHRRYPHSVKGRTHRGQHDSERARAGLTWADAAAAQPHFTPRAVTRIHPR